MTLVNGCSSDAAFAEKTPTFSEQANSTFSKQAISPVPAPVNVFDDYINAEYAIADGFDFPVGDAGSKNKGWYIAAKFAETKKGSINSGEEWNWTGSGERAVYSIANGKVVFAQDGGAEWGSVVIIEHSFYENHEKRKVRSLYAHLSEIKVKEGEQVIRRQLIAASGQNSENRSPLYLEIRLDGKLLPIYQPSADGKDENWIKERYAAPADFINNHRKLFTPQQEPALVLVDQETYKMRLYRKGQFQEEYDVSFGQSKGRKEIEGDNKTPKGMYFVIQKHRGDFPGTYGNYYGGHWIKINYPNKYDAARGKASGLISSQQEAKITAEWEKRAPTLEKIGLGGGIGFHGWAQEWSNSGQRHLSWGCVVMHIYDIKQIYDRLPEGTMVIIF